MANITVNVTKKSKLRTKRCVLMRHHICRSKPIKRKYIGQSVALTFFRLCTEDVDTICTSLDHVITSYLANMFEKLDDLSKGQGSPSHKQ